MTEALSIEARLKTVITYLRIMGAVYPIVPDVSIGIIESVIEEIELLRRQAEEAQP